MGGYRSSRWSKQYERCLTVQECYSLSVSAFKTRLHSRNGYDGTCQVFKQFPHERHLAFCDLNFPFFENPSLNIIFEYPYFEGNLIQVRQKIRFNSTRPIVGGERWWFLCPDCGIIRSELFVVPGEDHFQCRCDANLIYASNLKTHSPRGIINGSHNR